MMDSFFWSSTGKNYIEPKRNFQAIGVIDFVQPFLIQKMDKPSVRLSNQKVKKVLTNGTIRVENHYKSGYELNSISMTIVDAHDAGAAADLNKSQTLYNLLTDGGYTLRGNELGPARFSLRFPTFLILELAPMPKKQEKANWNAALSAAGAATDALIGGGGLGGAIDAISTGLEFLSPHVTGVWTFKDPVISRVDFGGSFDYSSDEIVMLNLTFDYNNFKYEKSAL